MSDLLVNAIMMYAMPNGYVMVELPAAFGDNPRVRTLDKGDTFTLAMKDQRGEDTAVISIKVES